MSRAFQPELDFQAARVAAEDGEALIIDLDGYEGPLHVLLRLARDQKVDLLQLSITRLADQYLTFVAQAQARQFSLAADYLVMAAWLTYLKSRLLLPKPEKTPADEPPVEDMAASLAFRLARLDALRQAAEALVQRPQLRQDVFPRGDPETLKIVPSTRLEGDLYSLMSAYISQRRREAERHYRPATVMAYGLDEARRRLRSLCGSLDRWTSLTDLAPDQLEEGQAPPASRLASTLSASLELVREGLVEIQQDQVFAPIFLRDRPVQIPWTG